MKKKGISLIVLVITIVVIIILAAAVILALGQNNPIASARIATVTQTKDSIESGVLMYASGIKTKTLGELSTKAILIEDENYKISDGSTATITIDGTEKTLYKIDASKAKEKLKIDVKQETTNAWYIDENGKTYLIYTTEESIPSYLKENGAIVSSLSDFLTYEGSGATSTYTITYNTNGGSEVASQTKNENEDITLASAPTKSNATFVCWKDSSNKKYNAGATYTANADLSLTAVWGYTATNISAMTSEADKQSIIGKSVSLTSTNGWTDWKVFSSDGTNIMLITGDYIPVDKLSIGHGFASGSHNTKYCVYSSTSRADLLSKLTTASTFDGFKDSAGTVVTTARIPTIDDFTKSYNAVEHAGTTYTDSSHTSGYPLIQKVYYKDNGVNGGYNVSSDSNGATSNDNVPSNSYWTGYGLPKTKTNYGNLWVIEDGTKAYGYWLASASASSTDNVLYVHCNGNVGSINYNSTNRGLRPVVILDSSVKLVQNIDGSNITYTLE